MEESPWSRLQRRCNEAEPDRWNLDTRGIRAV